MPSLNNVTTTLSSGLGLIPNWIYTGIDYPSKLLDYASALISLSAKTTSLSSALMVSGVFSVAALTGACLLSKGVAHAAEYMDMPSMGEGATFVADISSQLSGYTFEAIKYVGMRTAVASFGASVACGYVTEPIAGMLSVIPNGASEIVKGTSLCLVGATRNISYNATLLSASAGFAKTVLSGEAPSLDNMFRSGLSFFGLQKSEESQETDNILMAKTNSL